MKIKDIGKVITGKTPSTDNLDFFDGPIMFITPPDVAQGFIIESSLRTITQRGFDSILSNTLNGISVVVGCIGSDMGNVAIIENKCATNQQINSITEFCDDVNPYYVYYYLSMRKAFLRKLAGVTTTPILPKSTFEEIDINCPLKIIQDKICSVLLALDRTINLNKRIISLLESEAKTLFDYWFTQFDFPNAEGKPYRASGGEMVWNDQLKREIPKGWAVGNLYDIADYINGLACQKFRPNAGELGIPVIKITEMHEGITEKTEVVSENIPNKHKIQDGDILFSWSATLEVMYWFGGVGGLNQHIFKVVPKSHFSKEYVYHQASAYVINFVKMAEARKTTMGHITTDHLNQSRIVLPPKPLINQFTEIVSPLHRMIGKLHQENRELINLRDWLLPMLMSGQATVE